MLASSGELYCIPSGRVNGTNGWAASEPRRRARASSEGRRDEPKPSATSARLTQGTYQTFQGYGEHSVIAKVFTP